MKLELQTTEEVNRLVNQNGMKLISKRELNRQLMFLGYKICPDRSFSYDNKSNDIPYHARHIGIIDEKTGHSFSHKCANNENLPKLQELRQWNFCFESGRIWEL